LRCGRGKVGAHFGDGYGKAMTGELLEGAFGDAKVGARDRR
jgi:hypothetical protein